MQDQANSQTRRRGRPKVRTEAETRDLVVAAAQRVFLSSGFRGASVSMVACEAGLSKRTIYDLFATKEEIMAHVVRACRQDLHRLIETRPVRTRDDMVDGLRSFLRSFAHILVNPTFIGLYRLVLAEAGSYPELANTFYREGPMRTIGKLAEWLERRRADGLLAFDDPTSLASMLVSMTIAEPLRQVAFGLIPIPDEARTIELADQALALFLHGCLVPAEVPEPVEVQAEA